MRQVGLLFAVAACGRLGFAEQAPGDASLAPDVRPDTRPDIADAPAPVPYAEFTMDADPSTGLTATDPTYTGACTACPVSVAGHLGNAIAFSGTEAVTLSFAVGVQPYTIAVWFSTSAQGSLLAKPYDLSSVYDVVNIATDPNGILIYETFDGAGTSYLSSTAPSVLGGWHHVAISWDGTTKALYLDGALQGTAIVPVVDSEQPLSLGTDTDFGASAVTYHGALDELRFYDHALAAAEVAQLAH